MDEKNYWGALEFRVCRDLDRVPSNRMRSVWCDGFVPESYYLEGPEPRIEGCAWICKGQQWQDKWSFTLWLSRLVNSQSKVNWESLLPPEDAVRWLSLDWNSKRVRIEPAAAVRAC